MSDYRYKRGRPLSVDPTKTTPATHRVTFAVTTEQLNKIRDDAYTARMPVSRFIREKVLS